MKVSIITPAYNAEATIAEAATSVMQQKHTHFEWIVVDNGSTDRTANILANYTSDPRVNLIRQSKNTGVSAARNTALDAATGDLICFIDADDKLPPQSLSSRVKIFAEHPEIHFVDGTVRIFRDDTNETISTYRPSFEGIPLKKLLTLDPSVFMGITWMVRKTAHRFKSGLTHGEDLLFFMSMAGEGKYTHVSEYIYECRKREGSAMTNLRGLENGYAAIAAELKTWPNIDHNDIRAFERKTRTIMLKSYLKKGMVLPAAQLFLRRLFA